jgi:multiple sugar transport system ATP-binding protein
MSEVKLRELWKTYDGGVDAVRNVNLDIADGEFLVLVGPSGCGKSTTLRMIAGLEEISRGQIMIGSRLVNDVPPKNRDIAMVFQNYALYPHMTVYDNMAFGLKLRKFKTTEIQQRVREAADLLGIGDLLDRRPKALSGGQRQRVAVGRAIVRKPEVFLFDEPLSNLDAKMRVQMRAEISRLHRRLGATMIYVTHDQVEAMTMGDRIVVMKDGVVQQIADPIKLYDQPANMFVAGFIGSPPMNFFPGELDLTGHPCSFRTSSFAMNLPEAWNGVLNQRSIRQAVLGIRPEAFSLASEGSSSMHGIPARVDVLEPMGSETYLYLRTGEQVFIARVDANAACVPDDRILLSAALAKAAIFDPQNGERIV